MSTFIDIVQETIDIVFDNVDVKDYYYETEGIEVVRQNVETMEFDIRPTEKFGKIDVYAEYDNEEVVKSSVYSYSEGEMVFVWNVRHNN